MDERTDQRVKLTITLPKKLYNAIKFLADSDDMSVEEFITSAVYDRTKASFESVDASDFLDS